MASKTTIFGTLACDIAVEYYEDKVYVQDLLFLDDFGNCPTAELSKENYNKIIDEWNKNIDHHAKYLILSQNDTGWIVLWPKEELSKDDLLFIKKEKQIKSKYQIIF